MKRVNYDREILSNFIILFIAATILIACGWVIYSNIREISPEQLSAIRLKFMLNSRKVLLPELRERTTFIILTLLSIPLCTALICLSGKFNDFKEYYRPPVIAGLNIFVLIVLFFCLYQPDITPQFMYILFDPVWDHPILLLGVLLLTVFMIHAVFKWNLDKYSSGIFILLLFIPLLQVSSCRLYSLELINNLIPFHPNIIAYAISRRRPEIMIITSMAFTPGCWRRSSKSIHLIC